MNHHNEGINDSVYTTNKIVLQERIKNANKTYFALQKFFKNKNLSKKLKLRLKKSFDWNT